MPPRQVKCKICRTPFYKMSITHRACSADCAIQLTKLDREKKARKEYLIQKVKMRSRRDWLKLAQESFNAYIRKRDEGLPCICCRKRASEGIFGGSWDAGHYLSVGAYPELRFTEDNCHKQLKSCNAGSGKFSHKQKTVSQAYREELIQKIGIERVDALEGPHEPKKWTIPELQEIRQTYADKLKQLKEAP